MKATNHLELQLLVQAWSYRHHTHLYTMLIQEILQESYVVNECKVMYTMSNICFILMENQH